MLITFFSEFHLSVRHCISNAVFNLGVIGVLAEGCSYGSHAQRSAIEV
jgi:hypothetical protein